MNPRISVEQIREEQARNEARTSDLLERPLALLDDAIDVLLACAVVAKKSHDQRHDDRFMFAFLCLISKMVSNAESAITLLKRGRYGDALVLLRVMLSAANTLQFLFFYDEHIEDWISYEKLVTTGNENAKERRRIYRIFEDKNVREKLERKGIHPSTDAYRVLSESAHSSLWGLQAYAARTYDEPVTHEVQFIPAYDPLRALIVVVTLVGLLMIPVDAFLDRYVDVSGEDEDWGKLEDKWTPVRAAMLHFVDIASPKIKELSK